jgi:hypothetical protein
MNSSSSKVTTEHLRRDAYLYVRQSSLHQVLNNTESTFHLTPDILSVEIEQHCCTRMKGIRK